jgi:hypothetical protein
MEDNVHRPGPLGARETRPVGSLRRLLPFTKPYRWRFLFAIAVSVGGLTAQVAQPEIVQRFIDEVLEGKMRERLVPYALVTLVLGFFWCFFAFVRRNVNGSIALGLEYRPVACHERCVHRLAGADVVIGADLPQCRDQLAHTIEVSRVPSAATSAGQPRSRAIAS